MKKAILLIVLLLAGCASLPIPGLKDAEPAAPVDVQAIVEASIEKSNALYSQPAEGDEIHVWTNERGNVEMDLAAAKVLINSIYELDSYKAVSEAMTARAMESEAALKEEQTRKWRWLRNGTIAGYVAGMATIILITIIAQ